MKGILVLIFIGLFSMGSLMLSQTPAFKIYQLSSMYIENNVNESGQVTYNFTSAKPADWVELSSLEKQTYMPIVISEDWSFFSHDGVDLKQLKIAILDFIDGKKLRGASTISQQVVKNLFTSGQRTFTRKAKELVSTILLEKLVSKEKILEIYLNIIQYGDGLYGLNQAALYYFKKPASDLRVKEAAFMAMLLPSPIRYAQSYREKKLSSYARQTINNILHKLTIVKVIKKKNLEALKQEPLSFESNSVLDYILKKLEDVSTDLQ